MSKHEEVKDHALEATNLPAPKSLADACWNSVLACRADNVIREATRSLFAFVLIEARIILGRCIEHGKKNGMNDINGVHAAAAALFEEAMDEARKSARIKGASDKDLKNWGQYKSDLGIALKCHAPLLGTDDEENPSLSGRSAITGWNKEFKEWCEALAHAEALASAEAQGIVSALGGAKQLAEGTDDGEVISVEGLDLSALPEDQQLALMQLVEDMAVLNASGDADAWAHVEGLFSTVATKVHNLISNQYRHLVEAVRDAA